MISPAGLRLTMFMCSRFVLSADLAGKFLDTLIIEPLCA